MDVFILLLSCVGGVWGLLTLLGFWFTDKKCVECKYYGPSEYMLQDVKGGYWHMGCYAEKHNTKYGYTEPIE